MVQDIKNKSEFLNIIGEKSINLVDYYATWCGACKLFDPVLNEIQDKYKSNLHVHFYKLNIEQLMDVASKEQVSATPTLIFYFNNQEIWRFVGYLDYDSLNEKINRLLNEYNLNN